MRRISSGCKNRKKNLKKHKNKLLKIFTLKREKQTITMTCFSHYTLSKQQVSTCGSQVEEDNMTLSQGSLRPSETTDVYSS